MENAPQEFVRRFLDGVIHHREKSSHIVRALMGTYEACRIFMVSYVCGDF